MPLTGGQSIIAPYWADVDLRGTGQVFYRQTTDPSLLARATNEIRAAIPRAQSMTITGLLIATWSEVGYFFQNTDKVTCLCIVTYTILLHSSFLNAYIYIS